MELTLKQRDAHVAALTDAAELEARFGRLEPEAILEAALDRFRDSLGAVSSFGADSAVLLHMIARLDPDLPVIFLDTGKHFGETLDYRDRLVEDLGLTNLRVVTPLPRSLVDRDPDGLLHKTNTDACCDIRKVEPMARAVQPFRAWITGRRRYQASSRSALPAFEAVGERVRVNPLVSFSTADQAAYMRSFDLRENPLVAYGYLSIGCFPCTQPSSRDDPRSGRWSGQAKTECGIHLSGLEQSLTSSEL